MNAGYTISLILRTFPLSLETLNSSVRKNIILLQTSLEAGILKNIGSTRFLDRLRNGTGVFANLGIEVFDDYWMNYRTKARHGMKVLPNRPTPTSKVTKSTKNRALKS